MKVLEFSSGLMKSLKKVSVENEPEKEVLDISKIDMKTDDQNTTEIETHEHVSSDILSCPFCGSIAKEITYIGDKTETCIECSGCGIKTKTVEFLFGKNGKPEEFNELLKIWNRRTFKEKEYLENKEELNQIRRYVATSDLKCYYCNKEKSQISFCAMGGNCLRLEDMKID